MALIKCPECGKEISSLAETCPNCAFPFSFINQVKFNIISDEEALLQLDKIDDNSAVSVLKYLAEKGNVVACRELGILYICGTRGITKNRDTAKKYFEIGIEANDALSHYWYVLRFSSEEDNKHMINDYEKLLSREDLPDKKRGTVLNNLAQLYENAEIKNYSKAYSLYKQAISIDDSNIIFCNNLQLVCMNSLKKYNEAIEYSNKVIALNSNNQYVAIAYNTLGVCYCDGKGVQKDLDKGIEFYKKSIQLGNDTASKNLRIIYNNLGVCYAEGNDVNIDLNKAIEFYKKAIELGSEAASQNLKALYDSHPEKRDDAHVEKNVYSIKCPNCGSPYVEKISLANKAGATAVFGVFSLGHISKTYKCKMCGYKW